MKTFSFFFSLLLCFCRCKNQDINQKINKKREGFWVEKYSDDSSHYVSKGFYKQNEPTRKWKYYLNGKIIKIEKYKTDYCYTKLYFKNGKTASKGKTKLDSIGKNYHWYYSGKWKYFDENGKLSITRIYNNGDLISETKTK